MDELLELREHIEQGNYVKALTLIGDMEEMSRLAEKIDQDDIKQEALKLITSPNI